MPDALDELCKLAAVERPEEIGLNGPVVGARVGEANVGEEALRLFEVVFDYGEHSSDDPRPDDTGAWLCRNDSFSTYRAGFDVRTYRLCQRILMFHVEGIDEPRHGKGVRC